MNTKKQSGYQKIREDVFTEYAGKYQFDAGMPRDVAEERARIDTDAYMDAMLQRMKVRK
jgi:hypothetical protein